MTTTDLVLANGNLAPDFRYLVNGLVVPDTATEDDFDVVWGLISQVERGRMWAIGDLILGSERLGYIPRGRYQEICKQRNVKYGTATQAVRVARFFPLNCRRIQLSFTHYQVVTGRDDAQELLQWCEETGATRRSLASKLGNLKRSKPRNHSDEECDKFFAEYLAVGNMKDLANRHGLKVSAFQECIYRARDRCDLSKPEDATTFSERALAATRDRRRGLDHKEAIARYGFKDAAELSNTMRAVNSGSESLILAMDEGVVAPATARTYAQWNDADKAEAAVAVVRKKQTQKELDTVGKKGWTQGMELIGLLSGIYDDCRGFKQNVPINSKSFPKKREKLDQIARQCRDVRDIVCEMVDKIEEGVNRCLLKIDE